MPTLQIWNSKEIDWGTFSQLTLHCCELGGSHLASKYAVQAEEAVPHMLERHQMVIAGAFQKCSMPISLLCL